MGKKCEYGHTWNLGGLCLVCGKTREQVRAAELDDNDIPTTNSPSIEETEKRLGHGFWGNQSTGYIHDRDNK